MKNMSWKEYKALKVRVLTNSYGELAEKWEDERDDRRVFYNIFHQIIDAIERLPARRLPNYVIVAMNAKIDEDRKVLDEIKERFKDR